MEIDINDINEQNINKIYDRYCDIDNDGNIMFEKYVVYCTYGYKLLAEHIEYSHNLIYDDELKHKMCVVIDVIMENKINFNKLGYYCNWEKRLEKITINDIPTFLLTRHCAKKMDVNYIKINVQFVMEIIEKNYMLQHINSLINNNEIHIYDIHKINTNMIIKYITTILCLSKTRILPPFVIKHKILCYFLKNLVFGNKIIVPIIKKQNKCIIS